MDFRCFFKDILFSKMFFSPHLMYLGPKHQPSKEYETRHDGNMQSISWKSTNQSSII